MKNQLILFFIFIFIISCQNPSNNKISNDKKERIMSISQKSIDKVISQLKEKFGNQESIRIEKGAKQVAAFWQSIDGDENAYIDFCTNYFIADSVELDNAFNSLEKHFESIEGNFTNMSMKLRFPIDVEDGKKPNLIDEMFASYNPAAHITDDYFKNKIAFLVLLNFPNYSLKEKNDLGKNWTRKDWAYARIADIFNSRVPAELILNFSKVNSETDMYISNYNIMMGNIIDKDNKVSFPSDMKLITHWNLRDELKANYANTDGLQKQEIIYKIMERIITQEIPKDVINNPNLKWEPFSNKVTKDGQDFKSEPEPNTRYKHLLKNYLALKDMDKYYPFYETYIQRQFDGVVEMSFEEVEKMFIDFISSNEVKETGKIIEKRLNRPLRPFDIWYDGFKDRSNLNMDEIDTKLKKMYPNSEVFAANLPAILQKLGFTSERAKWLSEKIAVDPSRGAGHAMGTRARWDKSRLRTRIGSDGMDYKGYNIAIHEFGHNVEQTFSLYNIDYYSLSSVPSNAFTEAFAFLFQSKDLQLLGIKPKDPNAEYLNTLDNLWSSYEIMGVALVDMYIWKWLYDNPTANENDLKNQMLITAKDVWNKYYAPVFGEKDSPILAIYSHIINYPLYLSAYPIGHLIEFQIEQFIKDKNFGKEVERITSIGRLTPQAWMETAVGNKLSIQPTLDAAKIAIEKLK